MGKCNFTLIGLLTTHFLKQIAISDQKRSLLQEKDLQYFPLSPPDLL